MATHRPTLDVLNAIEVASPCLVSWEHMHGNEHVRSCDQCQQRVYDLAEMTTADANELLGGAGSQPCVRFFRQRNGRVMTADSPAGLPGMIWRRLRRHAAWAASLFAVLFFPGCQTQGVPVRHIKPLKPQSAPIRDTLGSPDESAPPPSDPTEGR